MMQGRVTFSVDAVMPSCSPNREHERLNADVCSSSATVGAEADAMVGTHAQDSVPNARTKLGLMGAATVVLLHEGLRKSPDRQSARGVGGACPSVGQAGALPESSAAPGSEASPRFFLFRLAAWSTEVR